MRWSVALVVVLAVAAGGVGAAPSGAAPAWAAQTRTLSGTITGSDGRAVSALLGFDLKDSRGRALAATGCVKSPTCPLVGYGVTQRINFDLGADGAADAGAWTTTWRVTVPAAATRVFVEAYPSGARHTGTNESRYGHAYRRNLPVTAARIDVRLPLVCGQGGSTGHISGQASRGGARVQLRRIAAWSLAAERPPPAVLGWNIGTTAADGSWLLPNLPSGQTYQVIATAADGTVKRYFGVPVRACKGTRLAVAF